MIELDFHPSHIVLEQFHDEMKKEFIENCNCGLYGNYEIILDRFKNDHAIACLKDGKFVGFTTWLRSKKVVDIDLTWVLPSERSFFTAKKFLNLVVKEFKRRRYVALTSKCVTLNGLCIAHHCGFVTDNFEDSYDNFREEYPYEKGKIHLYKAIHVTKYLREL